ncbi:MAG TPA: transposase [Ktedonobacteraceae bacterium]|jgi:hypothetical protein
MGDRMQKPIVRATQRKEQAIADGKTWQWPRLKKTAEQEQRTIVFVDEAGFALLPMIVRTSAPRGHTPVLRVTLTRDHLSAMGGITPPGRLFLPMQERASKAEDVMRFVQMRLRTISGKLLVMWDGSPLHRTEVSTPFLASPMGIRSVCLATRLISIRKNGCGTCSNAANARTGAVGIWLTCITNWSVPRNAFDIGSIPFRMALPMLLLRFRCLSRYQ